jgi:hypothetical protein
MLSKDCLVAVGCDFLLDLMHFDENSTQPVIYTVHTSLLLQLLYDSCKYQPRNGLSAEVISFVN